MPLAALFLSDLIDGFYSLIVMLFVYLGFSAGPLFGYWLLQNRTSLFSVPHRGIAEKNQSVACGQSQGKP